MSTPTLARASAEVRSVDLQRPLAWITLGARDLLRCGWVSWLHGVAVALFGGVIVVVAHERFWLLAGALSGFMVIAPVLATGLYALSRALERGEPGRPSLVLQTWLSGWRGDSGQGNAGPMVVFGLLLFVAASGWVLTSSALITLLTPQPVAAPADFVRHVVLAREGWLFELWLAMGGVLAAPIFASSVVAMPLLLERKAGVLEAVVTSWQVVLHNPVPMALWAALIMGLTLLGMATALLGLVVVVPLLGHASWHAYRELVAPAAGDA